WYYAGMIMAKNYESEYKNKALKQKYDEANLFNSIAKEYEYFMRCYEIDILPNEKGKVKPKYTKYIRENLLNCRNSFIDAGNYYLEKKDYVAASKSFETFLSYVGLPVMEPLTKKDEPLKKDTLYYSIVFWTGYSAYLGHIEKSNPELAEKASKYMAITIEEGAGYSNEESKKAAFSIIDDGLTPKKDTINRIMYLEKAIAAFPKEGQFYTRLLNIYLGKNNIPKAIECIDKSIEINPKQPQMYEIKGQLLEIKEDFEGAVANYQKAVDVDPNMTTSYGNMGRVYYNMAAKEQMKAADIKDVKKYNEQMAKAKPYFEKAAPCFEKVREAKPDDKDILKALRTIYYNLNQGAKFDELDKIIGDK
ncbi:MAG: tetratricopeptide repeat protein, partial [Bacteroidales bacterium]|nr:tetratricopeptide repeat protein [Bacteroidales bacterium]